MTIRKLFLLTILFVRMSISEINADMLVLLKALLLMN